MKIFLEKSDFCTYPDVCKNMYILTADGDVYNTVSEKYLNKYEDKDGYYRVGLKMTSGKYKTIFVHRLVAWEFVKNENNNPVVDHLDGNKKNNYYKNLEWVTVKENTNRAEKIGLRKVQGSYNGNSTYSDKFIHSICKMLEQGHGQMYIYRKLTGDVTLQEKNRKLYQLIYRLRFREDWEYITKYYSYTPESTDDKDTKLFTIKETSAHDEEMVHQICRYLECGWDNIQILKHIRGEHVRARDDKHLYDLIMCLRNRKRWKYINQLYKY